MSKSPLPEDQLADLKAAFTLFDDNGDGEITASELGAVMRQLGLKPSDTELEDLMNEIDTDRSGTISFEGKYIQPSPPGSHSKPYACLQLREYAYGSTEFASIMAQKVHASDSEAELKAAFEVFDKDKNGTISSNELRHLMKSIGEDLTDGDIDEMIKEADKNGDGNIDYQEFVQLMQ